MEEEAFYLESYGFCAKQHWQLKSYIFPPYCIIKNKINKSIFQF